MAQENNNANIIKIAVGLSSQDVETIYQQGVDELWFYDVQTLRYKVVKIIDTTDPYNIRFRIKSKNGGCNCSECQHRRKTYTIKKSMVSLVFFRLNPTYFARQGWFLERKGKIYSVCTSDSTNRFNACFSQRAKNLNLILELSRQGRVKQEAGIGIKSIRLTDEEKSFIYNADSKKLTNRIEKSKLIIRLPPHFGRLAPIEEWTEEQKAFFYNDSINSLDIEKTDLFFSERIPADLFKKTRNSCTASLDDSTDNLIDRLNYLSVKVRRNGGGNEYITLYIKKEILLRIPFFSNLFDFRQRAKSSPSYLVELDTLFNDTEIKYLINASFYKPQELIRKYKNPTIILKIATLLDRSGQRKDAEALEVKLKKELRRFISMPNGNALLLPKSSEKHDSDEHSLYSQKNKDFVKALNELRQSFENTNLNYLIGQLESDFIAYIISPKNKKNNHVTTLQFQKLKEFADKRKQDKSHWTFFILHQENLKPIHITEPLHEIQNQIDDFFEGVPKKTVEEIEEILKDRQLNYSEIELQKKNPYSRYSGVAIFLNVVLCLLLIQPIYWIFVENKWLINNEKRNYRIYELIRQKRINDSNSNVNEQGFKKSKDLKGFFKKPLHKLNKLKQRRKGKKQVGLLQLSK